MDRRDFPAVHLRNISQMRHIGKVPFGYGDGRFFNLAGPYRTDTAPGSSQREHADPVKKAPQLNVRHSPGCRVPSRQAPLPALSPQCPAVRQPQYIAPATNKWIIGMDIFPGIPYRHFKIQRRHIPNDLIRVPPIRKQ